MQADEMSESESQHVLSVLELIPLKCSPKHNGKFISFIATATNPDEDKRETETIDSQSQQHESEPEKDQKSSLNGSLQRLKKGILLSLNELHQRLYQRKNACQVHTVLLYI